MGICGPRIKNRAIGRPGVSPIAAGVVFNLCEKVSQTWIVAKDHAVGLAAEYLLRDQCYQRAEENAGEHESDHVETLDHLPALPIIDFSLCPMIQNNDQKSEDHTARDDELNEVGESHVAQLLAAVQPGYAQAPVGEPHRLQTFFRGLGVWS